MTSFHHTVSTIVDSAAMKMDLTMGASTAPQLVISGFIFLFILYWALIQLTEYLIKRYYPVFYKSVNNGEDRYRWLLPLIFFLLRAIFGLLITFPSCIYAAYSTPWGTDQLVNIPGAVCLISQSVPWVAELHLQMEVSTEILLHHVFCLLFVADLILDPTVLMVKPLYMYIASQIGDVTVAMGKFLRNTGHEIPTSWPLWCSKLCSINVLIWSKTGFAMYAMGKVFQSPHRIIDWFGMYFMVFFSIYTLQGAHKNLIYLGITTPSIEGPRGLTLKNGWWCSRFNITMAAAALCVFLTKPIVYSLLRPQTMGSTEHIAMWMESAASVLVLFFSIKAFTSLWESTMQGKIVMEGGNACQKKGELYLRIGSVLAAFAVILAGFRGPANVFSVLDNDARAGAVAMAFVVWDLLVRIGIWMSVGEEQRRIQMPKEFAVEKGLTEERTRKTRDLVNSRRQLRKIWGDVVVLCFPLVLKTGYSGPELIYAVFFSHSMIQAIDQISSFTRSHLKRDAQAKPRHLFRSLLLGLALTSSCLSLAVVCRMLCDTWGCDEHQQEMLWTSLIVAVSAVATGWLIPTKRNTSKTWKRIVHSRLACFLHKYYRADILVPVGFALTQAIGVWEVYFTESFTKTPVNSAGFENLRDVLGSLPAVFGNVVFLLLGTTVTWLEW